MTIVARNLIDMPRFIDDVTVPDSQWRYFMSGRSSAYPLMITNPIHVREKDGADPITGGMAWRIYIGATSSANILMHPIGNLEAGAEVYVHLCYATNAAGQQQKIGILPLNPAGGVIGATGRSTQEFDKYAIKSALEYPDPTVTDGYEGREYTFTIPEISGEKIVDDYGDTIGNAGATADYQWALCLYNASGSPSTGVYGAYSGARVDVGPYPDGFVPGYLDGSMAAADDHEYSWTGDPFKSDSIVEAAAPAVLVERPAAPIADDEENTLTIPAGEGATWTLNGEPAVSGIYDAEGDETVVVTLQPAEGYTFGDGDAADEWTFTFTVNPIEVTPAAPAFDDVLFEYTIPDMAGVAYAVNGTPTAAGTYAGAALDSLTITAAALDGYTLTGVSEWPYTFPAAPDPWPAPEEPGAEHIVRGGTDVAALLRLTDPEDVEICRKAFEIVLLTAWGYTRGRGFSDTLEPTYPIRRVVDLAAVRLAGNPEQVSRWAIAGDSETMTPFQGFTLAERHILDRYRRRTA